MSETAQIELKKRKRKRSKGQGLGVLSPAKAPGHADHIPQQEAGGKKRQHPEGQSSKQQQVLRCVEDHKLSVCMHSDVGTNWFCCKSPMLLEHQQGHFAPFN